MNTTLIRNYNKMDQHVQEHLTLRAHWNINE